MHFRFLVPWYDKILRWSAHPKATRYLALVSFIDASFFPISPLFMILPMSVAEPKRAFQFAGIVIVSSFFGGILGYGLGFFAFEGIVNPFINMMGYSGYYQLAAQWFQEWGFWAILFGCVTPFIPYKIFTIGAGVMQLHFGWFLLASLTGRTIRFLLIATIIRWGGPKAEPLFRKTLLKITNYQPS
ncbi:MAG TPA: VTT domain-containing protein [Gammaproteobacteria bacterium]|nr:VTT domain-containing protein [Gammaproteobacteria bacterium]